MILIFFAKILFLLTDKRMSAKTSSIPPIWEFCFKNFFGCFFLFSEMFLKLVCYFLYIQKRYRREVDCGHQSFRRSKILL